MAANSPFPCPPASSFQTLVDDNDPRIIYSGGWIAGGDSGLECEGTTHGAESADVTATLNFNGVGVQVFGSVGVAANDGSPSSTYQIDNLPATTFAFSANGQNNYRVPFYSSPLLNSGNHTLVITSLGNNNSRIWLDYILYYPSTNELVASNASIPASSASSTSTSSTSSATNTAHEASTDTVAIVGGVLGGVVGIILAVFFAYIMLQRRRKHTYQSVAPTPFDGLINHTAIPSHSVSASVSSAPMTSINPTASVTTWTNPISPVATTSASQSYPTYAQETQRVPENRSPPIYEP